MPVTMAFVQSVPSGIGFIMKNTHTDTPTHWKHALVFNTDEFTLYTRSVKKRASSPTVAEVSF